MKSMINALMYVFSWNKMKDFPPLETFCNQVLSLDGQNFSSGASLPTFYTLCLFTTRRNPFFTMPFLSSLLFTFKVLIIYFLSWLLFTFQRTGSRVCFIIRILYGRFEHWAIVDCDRHNCYQSLAVGWLRTSLCCSLQSGWDTAHQDCETPLLHRPSRSNKQCEKIDDLST